MIGYNVSHTTLKSEIEKENATWFSRAADKTSDAAAKKEFVGKGIWGDIKRVYMRLQGFKCGYCERRLEGSRFGNIEHDVEHFRPKGAVKRWPTPAIASDRGIDYNTSWMGADNRGYYLLGHHEQNYLMSCKTCNSSLKGNYFPIFGPRQRDAANPAGLLTEQSLLIYPIGNFDTDPEELIKFTGVLPLPVHASGLNRSRAEVTIDLFALDTREGLILERAEIILSLHTALGGLGHSSPRTRRAATLLVDMLVSKRSPHANCARSFHDLWISDRKRARTIADSVADYVEARL